MRGLMLGFVAVASLTNVAMAVPADPTAPEAKSRELQDSPCAHLPAEAKTECVLREMAVQVAPSTDKQLADATGAPPQQRRIGVIGNIVRGAGGFVRVVTRPVFVVGGAIFGGDRAEAATPDRPRQPRRREQAQR